MSKHQIIEESKFSYGKRIVIEYERIYTPIVKGFPPVDLKIDEKKYTAVVTAVVSNRLNPESITLADVFYILQETLHDASSDLRIISWTYESDSVILVLPA